MRTRVLHITTLLIKLLNTIITKKELGRLAHPATPQMAEECLSKRRKRTQIPLSLWIKSCKARKELLKQKNADKLMWLQIGTARETWDVA